MNDLSVYSAPIGNLFETPSNLGLWDQYRLTNDQVEFFHAKGYLAGIRVLNDEQVDALRKELAELIDPNHPGHNLFYEFHSNESTDPSTVLFHALGAWRISEGLHDVLWNPRFLVAASQLL